MEVDNIIDEEVDNIKHEKIDEKSTDTSVKQQLIECIPDILIIFRELSEEYLEVQNERAEKILKLKKNKLIC